MRLCLRLEDEQKSCAIWGVYLLRVTLTLVGDVYLNSGKDEHNATVNKLPL